MIKTRIMDNGNDDEEDNDVHDYQIDKDNNIYYDSDDNDDDN